MNDHQECNDQPTDERFYCCDQMQQQLSHVCGEHTDPFECPNQLISYNVKFNEYGLIIHDGGTSSISIRCCPWCGTQLPVSLRERWFTELEACGIEASDEFAIPIAYRSDQWYRGESQP